MAERFLAEMQVDGFSSTHHGNEVSIDEQRRKLEHIVAAADEVWG